MFFEEKFVLEYMRDNLVNLLTKECEVENARYHHNTGYAEAASVVQWGILSLNLLNKLGIKNYSSKFLEIMSDTSSHVNGIDGVSLAVVGLNDLSPNEYEYDPFNFTQVDFLVDSGIKAYRTSVNYGNEFISKELIYPKSLRAIDLRLIEYINLIDNDENLKSRHNMLLKVIESYNCISEIAFAIEKMNLNIPIREMSFNRNYTLDVKRLIRLPKLSLKVNDN